MPEPPPKDPADSLQPRPSAAPDAHVVSSVEDADAASVARIGAVPEDSFGNYSDDELKDDAAGVLLDSRPCWRCQARSWTTLSKKGHC